MVRTSALRKSGLGLIGLLAGGCQPAPDAPDTQSLANMRLTATQRAFIETTAPLAAEIEARARSKGASMPASAVLTHAALESDWGTSMRARRDNNYFGITCKTLSERCARGAAHNFRTYASAAESFADYERLILNKERYRFVAIANTDSAYFIELKKSKYAEETDMDTRLENRYKSAPFRAIAAAYRTDAQQSVVANTIATRTNAARTEHSDPDAVPMPTLRAAPTLAARVESETPPVRAQPPAVAKQSTHDYAAQVPPAPHRTPARDAAYGTQRSTHQAYNSSEKKSALARVFAEAKAGFELRFYK